MSEQNVEQNTEQGMFSNPADVTEGDRMARAMQAFGDEGLEQVNSESSVQDEIAEIEQQREEPKQEDRSEYYARLVEKDKEIRQLKSQLKGNSGQVDIKALAKENPIKALQELGIGMDQILDIWAGSSADAETVEDTKEDPMTSEIDKIRQEIAELKRERENAEYQNNFKSEVNRLDQILNDKDATWEFIKNAKDDTSIHRHGSYGLVMETATELYKVREEEPTYAEVLDAVEKHLEEHYGNLYKRLSGINKLKNGFEVAPKDMSKITKEMSKAALPGPTLSNQNSSDTPVPRGLEEQERYARALQLLEDVGD